MADTGAAQKTKPAPAETAKKSRPLAELATLFSAQPGNYAADYGLALLSAGRAKDAAAALGKLHATTPLTGLARIVLAQARFDSFDIPGAEALVMEQRKTFEAEALGLRLLAEIQLEKGQREDAISSLKAAYAQDARDSRTTELLIMLGQLKRADFPDVPSDVDSMDDEAPSAAAEVNQRRLKGTLQKAGITAVVMLVFISIYSWRVGVQAKVAKLVGEAKTDRQKNDLEALLRAEKKYQEAVDSMGSHKGALSGLAEVESFLVLEHAKADAVPALSAISKKVVDKDVNTGERFLAQAVSLITAGTPAIADQLLETTIKNGGIDSRVLYASGVSALAVDKFASAKDALRKAYELDPYHPAIAATLGDLFTIEGDLRNADFYYRKAVDANPDHLRASARLLWSRLALGDDTAVIQPKLAELSAKKSTASPAHALAITVAEVAFAAVAGDRAKAKADATLLLTQNKNDAWIQSAMSNLLLQAGDKTGLVALESQLKRYGSLPRVTMDVAKVLAKNGKPEDGEAKLKADKELYDSAKGQAFLGHLYMNAGNAKVAAEWFDKALKQDEKNADALYGVGRIAHSQKSWEKALVAYARALEGRPTYAEVYHQVGNVYVENKEYDNARTNFGMAEKMYRQSAAGAVAFNGLYEDVAKSFDRQGGKDGKSNAAKWRARIKKI